MSPHITIDTTAEGEVEIWLNEEGRDLLVKELNALGMNKNNDHFHMGSWEGAEVKIGAIAYRPGDKIVHAAKVIFRTDAEAGRFFPHVLP